jgi:hypothetical protein
VQAGVESIKAVIKIAILYPFNIGGSSRDGRIISFETHPCQVISESEDRSKSTRFEKRSPKRRSRDLLHSGLTQLRKGWGCGGFEKGCDLLQTPVFHLRTAINCPPF